MTGLVGMGVDGPGKDVGDYGVCGGCEPGDERGGMRGGSGGLVLARVCVGAEVGVLLGCLVLLGKVVIYGCFAELVCKSKLD